jgi:hypothetical protein
MKRRAEPEFPIRTQIRRRRINLRAETEAAAERNDQVQRSDQKQRNHKSPLGNNPGSAGHSGETVMHSILLKENVPFFFAKLDRADAEQIVALAAAYQSAVRKSDPAGMQKNCAALQNAVLRGEQRTGIALLQPDPAQATYGSALIMLSSVIRQEIETLASQYSPADFSKSFPSIDAADRWLSQQTTVTVSRLSVDTSSRFGLLAGHSEANSVVLTGKDHRRSVGYRYGVLEEELTRIFGGNPDSYRAHWPEKHPGTELCCMCSTKNSRLGINTLYYVKHMHYFCVYRTKVGEAGSALDGKQLLAGVIDRLAGRPRGRFCPQCGRPVEETDAFCMKCGAPIPKQNTAGCS